MKKFGFILALLFFVFSLAGCSEEAPTSGLVENKPLEITETTPVPIEVVRDEEINKDEKTINTKTIKTDPQPDGSYACNCTKTCPSMSCSEAQYQLNECGCSARDADEDGVACDAQCQ